MKDKTMSVYQMMIGKPTEKFKNTKQGSIMEWEIIFTKDAKRKKPGRKPRPGQIRQNILIPSFLIEHARAYGSVSGFFEKAARNFILTPTFKKQVKDKQIE